MADVVGAPPRKRLRLLTAAAAGRPPPVAPWRAIPASEDAPVVPEPPPPPPAPAAPWEPPDRLARDMRGLKVAAMLRRQPPPSAPAPCRNASGGRAGPRSSPAPRGALVHGPRHRPAARLTALAGRQPQPGPQARRPPRLASAYPGVEDVLLLPLRRRADTRTVLLVLQHPAAREVVGDRLRRDLGQRGCAAEIAPVACLESLASLQQHAAAAAPKPKPGARSPLCSTPVYVTPPTAVTIPRKPPRAPPATSTGYHPPASPGSLPSAAAAAGALVWARPRTQPTPPPPRPLPRNTPPGPAPPPPPPTTPGAPFAPVAATYAYGSTIGAEESHVTEFKVTLQQTTLARVLNAFINSNGGRVFFGVTDTRRVLGAPIPHDQRDRIRLLVDKTLNSFSPQVDCTLVDIDFPAVLTGHASTGPDLRLAVITVRRDAHLHSLAGVYFTDATRTVAWQRAGASCLAMQSDLIARRLCIANASRRSLGLHPLPPPDPSF
eukprot:TRINITY_DN4443_c0_g1_i1.p2 TRINITY_DN4443_c0_g1~~TRINITY_DN4443_c0_g1_i1.p2  ORF type:complete len:492 (-),score=110.84 TRINITY_DN4443_c0_g1_i1:114-1589(-)